MPRTITAATAPLLRERPLKRTNSFGDAKARARVGLPGGFSHQGRRYSRSTYTDRMSLFPILGLTLVPCVSFLGYVLRRNGNLVRTDRHRKYVAAQLHETADCNGCK